MNADMLIAKYPVSIDLITELKNIFPSIILYNLVVIANFSIRNLPTNNRDITTASPTNANRKVPIFLSISLEGFAVKSQQR